jgi:DNA-binding response OmpR family regulator
MEKNKALVIDDEQIVLDSVSKILTDEHYEVDVSCRIVPRFSISFQDPHHP